MYPAEIDRDLVKQPIEAATRLLVAHEAWRGGGAGQHCSVQPSGVLLRCSIRNALR